MATQKPISTISYNTEAYLKEKLDTWLKAHIIQAYMYICHKGEDGDKDHIHLRIEPNKRVDKMDLQEALKEYQIGKDKPLGVRPFRESKEEDWLLYAVHDPQYLAVKYPDDKHEKIPYTWQDIKAPDDYDVEVAYIRAKSHMQHTSASLASRMQSGSVSPVNLIKEGENPYVVNAIMRALSHSDYQRVQEELYVARKQYAMLKAAIEAEGYKVMSDDDGNVLLDR